MYRVLREEARALAEQLAKFSQKYQLLKAQKQHLVEKESLQLQEYESLRTETNLLVTKCDESDVAIKSLTTAVEHKDKILKLIKVQLGLQDVPNTEIEVVSLI